jgi:WD40 repeat protein
MIEFYSMKPFGGLLWMMALAGMISSLISSSAIQAGNAQAHSSYDAKPGEPVVDEPISKPTSSEPSQGPKLEPISSRLKRELLHPHQTGILCGLSFSPDGNKIIAGDYPGGLVQVWEVKTGKALARFETGVGYRSTRDYLFISPDWKTAYVSYTRKRKASQFERDGKRITRVDYEGDVRAWDLATGKLVGAYESNPSREINWMALAPDASTFATFETLSGETIGERNSAATLWNVRTKEARALPFDLLPIGVFSPDSKTFAAQVNKPDGARVAAIKLFDVATAREKLAIPILEKDAQRIGFMAFSPNGALLIGQVRDEGGTCQHWLKFWDTTTGLELGSIAGEKSEYFVWMAFSPDSRTLAVSTGATNSAKIHLFDLALRDLRKTVVLAADASTWPPAFSPDGKWLAVATQPFPKFPGPKEPEPKDLPQPRIHLIESASGMVRETMVCQQGYPASICFSSDGKTMATSGYGRVLLWDMTKPPGDQ